MRLRRRGKIKRKKKKKRGKVKERKGKRREEETLRGYRVLFFTFN